MRSPPTLHGLIGQIALCIQPVALPYGFLDVLNPSQVAAFEPADFESKTVGAQVNGCEEIFGLHGV